jgi:4-oxalocrotonate tautomerase
MPIVTIEQSGGRTLEQRRQLAKGITAAFVSSYELRPNQVTIIFHDLQPADFAKDGVLYSDRDTQEARA